MVPVTLPAEMVSSVSLWGRNSDMSVVGDCNSRLASGCKDDTDSGVGLSDMGDEQGVMAGDTLGFGEGHGELSALAPPSIVGRVTWSVSFNDAPMLWPIDDPHGYHKDSGLDGRSSSTIEAESSGILDVSDGLVCILSGERDTDSEIEVWKVVTSLSLVCSFCSSTAKISIRKQIKTGKLI